MVLALAGDSTITNVFDRPVLAFFADSLAVFFEAFLGGAFFLEVAFFFVCFVVFFFAVLGIAIKPFQRHRQFRTAQSTCGQHQRRHQLPPSLHPGGPVGLGRAYLPSRSISRKRDHVTSYLVHSLTVGLHDVFGLLIERRPGLEQFRHSNGGFAPG